MRPNVLFSMFALGLAACTGGVDDPHEHNEGEVITTATLTFTPDGGGDALTFTWSDPENDGSPVIDPIELDAGSTWDVEITFLNALEDPPEDLTVEVAAESSEHQVFFYGTAVSGPASDVVDAALTHAYADTDAGGLPIGLQNTMVGAAGSGDLTVMLRHLPEEDGSAVKVAGLAEELAANGASGLPGDVDLLAVFPVTVQ
jgi:hypothetical protein